MYPRKTAILLRFSLLLTFVTISTLTLKFTSINDVDINVNNGQFWQILGTQKGKRKQARQWVCRHHKQEC